jgi:hypothetical protein
MRTLASLLFSGAVALLVAGGRESLAQNLLTNPGFTTGLTGWQHDASLVSWVASPDEDGSGGSAHLGTNGNTGSGVTQCVNGIQGGQAYEQGGFYRVPSGQGSSMFNIVAFGGFYAGANCTGTFTGGPNSVTLQNSAVPTDTWFFVSVINRAPASVNSMSVTFVFEDAQGQGAHAFFDNAVVQVTDAALFLNNGRFVVTATWHTADGNRGQAHAVTLTDDTGYFWFFSASNVEMVTKVLDGCPLNHRFWVFAGGLTNVNTVITVTDTRTETSNSYTNPLNTAFLPLQDTSAFACP